MSFNTLKRQLRQQERLRPNWGFRLKIRPMGKALGRLAVIVAIAISFFVPRVAAQMNIIRPESVVIPAYITPSPVIDPRVAALDAFFLKYKCPYHDSQVYISVADKNGLDYRLLPALSVLEESCGKHNPVNNLFGYYGNGKYGLHPFDSIADGIEYVGKQLAENRLYKGKTLKQKLKTYNSVNPLYYSEIISLMNQIEKE